MALKVTDNQYGRLS